MIDPFSSLANRSAGRHGPVMLTYHSVSRGAEVPEWPWAVSVRRLKAQLDYLAGEGWTTPTMSELLAEPAGWPARTVVITFDDGYSDNLAAGEELVKRGLRASWFIVSGAIGRPPVWPATGRPAGRLLNAEELRGLHAAGMEIGSHTVSHVRLNEVDEARRREELTQSRDDIENVLGAPVHSFAYPYGAWDDVCAKAVRDAGYRGACTTRTGWALRDDNPYTLRRLSVFNTDSVGSLIHKLNSGSNDVSFKTLSRQFLQRAAMRLRGAPQ
jgi:peptidoglycan/xylan/chitin deacetylase (PgdA/CDA1 family)